METEGSLERSRGPKNKFASEDTCHTSRRANCLGNEIPSPPSNSQIGENSSLLWGSALSFDSANKPKDYPSSVVLHCLL